MINSKANFFYFEPLNLGAMMQCQNPHMVNIHCVAHRLAFCTSQAASENSHLQAHQQILTDLFYYFKVKAVTCISKQFYGKQSLILSTSKSQLYNNISNYEYLIIHLLKGNSKRQSKLKEIQNILDDPCLTIKEIHSVRWLSYFTALSTVQRTLDSLLTYLGEADGNKDPKAAGLRKKVVKLGQILQNYCFCQFMYS